MSLSKTKQNVQQQRVSVLESGENDECVKIQVERYDENLGWYTANSLEIPRQQLPLLEQSLSNLKTSSPRTADSNVVPFPTVTEE